MASAAVAVPSVVTVTEAPVPKALTEQELTDIFRSRQAELQALVAVSLVYCSRRAWTEVEIGIGITHRRSRSWKQKGLNTREASSEHSSFSPWLTDDENDYAEDRLVIETLEEAYTTAPSRKCFKQIGGVLVERTVKDVLPELQTHLKTVS